MGRPLGRPHDTEGQYDVLRTVLEGLDQYTQPGQVIHLPFRWPEKRSKVRADSAPREVPPIVNLLKRKPWLLTNMISGRIPAGPAGGRSPEDP